MPQPQINTIPVSDPEDPRVSEFRELRENRLPKPIEGAPQGVFIAEGEKVVRRFAEGASRFGLRSVLVLESRIERDQSWLAKLPAGTPIYAASQGVMDRIVGFPIHRGVLASGLRLPDPPIRGLLAESEVVVVLEGLANHDNMGGIFRAAAALCHRPLILLDPTSCDPLYRKAIRVSMGHALAVPFARLAPWPGGLGQLRECGFETVALSLGERAVPMREALASCGHRVALLLGAEGPGLTERAIASVDACARIGMETGVDSLNVVTAAAIALHEIRNRALCERNQTHGPASV